jgi:hypothetical protein
MISATCVNTGNTLHLVKQDWIELTFYIIKGRLTPELHQICKQDIWSLSIIDMLTWPPDGDGTPRASLTCQEFAAEKLLDPWGTKFGILGYCDTCHMVADSVN